MHLKRNVSIAIVGGGIRGTSLVERIGANVPELLPDATLDLYLIDPYPVGPGRIWRCDQQRTLLANSFAVNITMFTDESVACEGPVLPDLSLWEWASQIRSGAIEGPADTELCAEITALTELSLPSRRLLSKYLTWAFDRIRHRLPANVALHVIQDRAVGVEDLPNGRQAVELALQDSAVLADTVVLTIGHLDAQPAASDAAFLEFADEKNLFYVPPGYSADLDLTRIGSGETTLIRGLGLAFLDLMALLTEARGGVYRPRTDGRLEYVASGREPFIVVGSRGGVPHPAKPSYRLTGDAPALPRFLEVDRLDGYAEDADLDFERDLKPLAAKEIAWAYYHELLTRHPDRCTMGLAEFDDGFAKTAWNTPDMEQLIRHAVPVLTDLWDIKTVVRPLAGKVFESAELLQEHIRHHIEADLKRRGDSKYSADLRMVDGLGSVLEQLAGPMLHRLPPRIVQEEVDARLGSLYKKVSTGSPPTRLRQLVALSEAGLVHFLGADMLVEIDKDLGLFRASSTSSPEVVEARTLIEARLPNATVLRTGDPLLASLRDRGKAVEQVLHAPDGETYERGLLVVDPSSFQIIAVSGHAHPRRFALGPFTTAGEATASFVFAHGNSLILRQNDTAARLMLRQLGEQDLTFGAAEVVPSRHVPDHD